MSSKVAKLVGAYRQHLGVPWQPGLAPIQRVIFAVYDKTDELRLRANVEEFALVTQQLGKRWLLIDLTESFPQWMAAQEYRDAYFESPDDLDGYPAGELTEFLALLVEQLKQRIEADAGPDRHQDNWGLIFDAVGREPPNMPPCRLAPLFDNGTSLGHERFPIRVAGWTDARLDQYIDKGTHHVKSSLSTEQGVQGHLSLLRYVLNDWGQHIDLDLLRGRIDFSQDDLILCIADLVHLPVAVPMSAERMRFSCRLLVRRHALLRALLNAPAEPPA